MRRETISRALSRVREDLLNSGVQLMFDQGWDARRRSGTKDDIDWVSLTVLRDYSRATASYGEPELAILEIFDLARLLDPSFWQQLRAADPQVIFETRTDIRFAVKHAPMLVDLIRQDNVEAVRNESNDLLDELKGKQLLTTILIEDKGQFSSPERIIYLLDGILKMYRGLASLRGNRGDDLIILACDSGSDKSFDFLGLASLMKEVKELILAAFNYRIFHRHQQMSATIGLIAQSLPVIREIDEMAENGSIERDKAEIIKNDIMRGMTKFLESGAITDDMEKESVHSPRALMRPEQRLLAAPAKSASDRPEPSKASSSGNETQSAVSSEDIERMRSFLRNLDENGAQGAHAPASRRKRSSKPRGSK